VLVLWLLTGALCHELGLHYEVNGQLVDNGTDIGLSRRYPNFDVNGPAWYLAETMQTE